MLSKLPAANAATLTGKQFFPTLISGPFHHGLMIVFTAAAIMSVIGAIVSALRGKSVELAEPPGGQPDHEQVTPVLAAGELDGAVRENVPEALAD